MQFMIIMFMITHYTIKNKNYIYVSIVCLMLAIYVIFFPLISNTIQKIFPSFGVCPYLTITGKPCPLCGGTRYIANLGNVFNDITYLFNPFGGIILGVIFEVIFRLWILLFNKNNKEVITFDIIYHIIVITIFIFYEILYIALQNFHS